MLKLSARNQFPGPRKGVAAAITDEPAAELGSAGAVVKATAVTVGAEG